MGEEMKITLGVGSLDVRTRVLWQQLRGNPCACTESMVPYAPMNPEVRVSSLSTGCDESGRRGDLGGKVSTESIR